MLVRLLSWWTIKSIDVIIVGQSCLDHLCNLCSLSTAIDIHFTRFFFVISNSSYMTIPYEMLSLHAVVSYFLECPFVMLLLRFKLVLILINFNYGLVARLFCSICLFFRDIHLYRKLVLTVNGLYILFPIFTVNFIFLYGGVY